MNTCRLRPVGNRFTSSTQPSSITRSSRGSSPVVSVSKTISRIELPYATLADQASISEPPVNLRVDKLRRVPQLPQDVSYVLPRCLYPSACINNEISALLLFSIRHLKRENVLELLLGHAGPRQDAFSLNLCRRRNHNYLVDAFSPALFKQKWNIEHDDRRSTTPMFLQEALGIFPDQRVHQSFQPLDRFWVTNHGFCKPFAIDDTVDDRARKRSLYDRCSLACIEPMHG